MSNFDDLAINQKVRRFCDDLTMPISLDIQLR